MVQSSFLLYSFKVLVAGAIAPVVAVPISSQGVVNEVERNSRRRVGRESRYSIQTYNVILPDFTKYNFLLNPTWFTRSLLVFSLHQLLMAPSNIQPIMYW